MSHPSWLPPKSTNEPVGHVTARMETTHAFGTPSISVSTQQTPKKFAPVVAPKPKYNPYKQPGGDGDFLPPPPPPVDDLGNITSQGAFPPPPPLDDVAFNVQVNPGGKTLEERRSSLDAEIDSLTSILADLESSSPYKPRIQQTTEAGKEASRLEPAPWVPPAIKKESLHIQETSFFLQPPFPRAEQQHWLRRSQGDGFPGALLLAGHVCQRSVHNVGPHACEQRGTASRRCQHAGFGYRHKEGTLPVLHGSAGACSGLMLL